MEENLKDKDGHEKIISHIKDYLETSYELLQVKLIKKVSRVISMAFFMLIVVVLGLLTLVLFSLTLASWMGDLLENRTQGYLLAAGILLVVLLIFLAAFKKIALFIFRNRIIRKIYEKQD
jgi:cytochrome c biogenesis protein CcdA